jgi:hypothetical protein
MNRVVEKTSIYMHQPRLEEDNEFNANHLLSAGNQMMSYLALQKPSCTNNAIEFAYSQSSAIRLFAGTKLHQYGITNDVLKSFLDYVREKAVSKTTVLEVGATRHHQHIIVTDTVVL